MSELFDRIAASAVVIPAEQAGLRPASEEPESSKRRAWLDCDAGAPADRARNCVLWNTGSRLCTRPAEPGSFGRDDGHMRLPALQGRVAPSRPQEITCDSPAPWGGPLQTQLWSMRLFYMTRVTYREPQGIFFMPLRPCPRGRPDALASRAIACGHRQRGWLPPSPGRLGYRMSELFDRIAASAVVIPAEQAGLRPASEEPE